jgi:hypothetical protein
MSRIVFAIALLMLLSAGCATQLSTRAAMVRVVNAREEVRGYKFLGTVTGSSLMTGVMQQAGFENAMNEVLEKAARLGATHVYVDPKYESRYWTTSEHVRGEAYRAPRRAIEWNSGALSKCRLWTVLCWDVIQTAPIK